MLFPKGFGGCGRSAIRLPWLTILFRSCIKKHLHCVPHHSQQGKRTDLEEEDVQVEGVQCLVYLDDSEPHTCHPKSDKEDLLSYNGLGEYGILAADLMTCDSFDYCYNGYATSSKVDKSLRSFLLFGIRICFTIRIMSAHTSLE